MNRLQTMFCYCQMFHKPGSDFVIHAHSWPWRRSKIREVIVVGSSRAVLVPRECLYLFEEIFNTESFEDVLLRLAAHAHEQ
jgi:hypothetical protein